MSNKIDPRCHVGETHGVYTIVDVLDEKDKYGHYIYKGVCNECGYVKFAAYGKFSGAKSATTICNHLDAGGRYVVSTMWSNERIGRIFKGMKRRCYDSDDKSYKWYGGKGIKICKEWLDNPKLFEEWSLTNGYASNLTIDRLNENEDYSPSNCRWITGEDNAKYKSTTSLIEVNGEVHTGQDWSRLLGLSQNIINTYIRKYGLENTIEFINKYQNNPKFKPKRNQSYYDLYMNNNTKLIMPD